MVKRCKGKGALLLIILLGISLPVLLVSCGGSDGGGSSTPATVADFSASPVTGTAPLTVAFTDNSAGAPTSWSWDFGDGSALDNTQNPSHTYATAGTYDVTLGADGPGGTDNVTKVGYITVTPPAPPATVAQFSGTPLTGDAPLDVQFTDLSTGAPDTWSWDFGDNTTSTQQDPLHTYAAGTYTVTLTADGPGGPDNVTKVDYITVGTPVPAPVAGFSADNTTGAAPLTVAFTDNSTGSITGYSWDFGDGSALDNTANPSHVYDVSSGTYTVALTVTGPGGSDTFTQDITADPTMYTDDFNRADNTVLGTQWTTPAGCSELQIVTEHAVATDNGVINCAYWSWNPFTADQYSQVVGTFVHRGPAVRIQTGLTLPNFYFARAQNATTLEIGKSVDGVLSIIDAPFTVGGLLPADVIRLEAVGDTLELFLNDSSVGTVTDNTFSSGAPGIFIDVTGVTLDNWEGGSL